MGKQDIFRCIKSDLCDILLTLLMPLQHAAGRAMQQRLHHICLFTVSMKQEVECCFLKNREGQILIGIFSSQ